MGHTHKKSVYYYVGQYSRNLGLYKVITVLNFNV